MIKYFFPSAMIIISLSAAGVYAMAKDWRKVIYWIAAATITTSVTF